jgi:hypothetical protein
MVRKGRQKMILKVLCFTTVLLCNTSFAQTKPQENYTIYGRGYQVEGYVKDGVIYDKGYRVKGYYKEDNRGQGTIYDRKYEPKGYYKRNK